MPREYGGGDGSDAFTRQGTPSPAITHQKLGERHGTDSPVEPAVGTNPDDTLLSDV